MTILNLVSCYKSTPDPGKILMTPLGNPALAESSANFRAVIGVTCKMNYKINQFSFAMYQEVNKLLLTL